MTLRVIVNKREKYLEVADILRELGVKVGFKMLEIGNYAISSECAVEGKSN